MSNEYFAVSGSPATSSQGASATMRSEFTAIAAGFDKLPTMAGNGSKLVQINSGGTAMAAIALTVGAILFGGAAGVLGQDGTNLFWDNTAKRLGIGNAAPTVALDVTGSLKASLSIGSAIPGGTGARTWWIDNNGGAGNITRFRSLGQDAATLGTYGFEVAKSDNTGISQILGITASGAQVTGSLTASTSVVTPLVQSSGAVNLVLGANGGTDWAIANSGKHWFPVVDNTQNIGSTSNRVASIFTPVIDSGTTGSLSLRTNNGETIATFGRNGTTVNQWDFLGSATGAAIIVRPGGTDSNVNTDIRSKGTGSIDFRTDGTVAAPTQFQVLHTASANRNITVTGSNGGNPTISTTAGSLAITPAVVLASSLNFSTAAGKIIPGATSISLRNNADSADNLLVTDAGVATVRSSLAWGTGIANFGTITKRKTADESVTSSTVLQDDDHLTFAIAANEEWVAEYYIDGGGVLSVAGVKVAFTTPSGATMNAGIVVSGAGTINNAKGTTSGVAFWAATANNESDLRLSLWVLNGSTPGNITLQWAQNSSNASAITFRKGSFMGATRVA